MLEELGTDPGLSLPQGRYQNAVFLLPLLPSLPSPYCSGSGRAPSEERASCDHKNAKKCLVLPEGEGPIPATYNLPKNPHAPKQRVKLRILMS